MSVMRTGVRIVAAASWLAVALLGCSAAIVGPSRSASPTTPSLAGEDESPFARFGVSLKAGRIVAVGEWHGVSREHAFVLALLADPAFWGTLDSIVVEFGAAPEQQVIDRYERGEDVAAATLARVWTTTTQQSGVWDSPLYRQFFERVRSLNAANPAHQVRVVLGDPGLGRPVCDAHGGATPTACRTRDQFLADRVAVELASGRHVLLFAGVFHVWRRPGAPEPSAVDHLSAAGYKTFVSISIGGPLSSNVAVQRHLVGLVPPALVDGSTLGDVAGSAIRSNSGVSCDNPPCGTETTQGSLGDFADAFIYLGP
jgi:hypothetical protein